MYNHIFTRDIISSIFVYQSQFVYIANQSKNCIQLYHQSGLPLNIFTKTYGNDYLQNYNAIQKPTKIFIDKNNFLYVCNQNHNITLFNLNNSLLQISFHTKLPSNDYLDTSLLHLQPIDISIKENERIFVLYSNPYKLGIYTYDGDKIHTIEFDTHIIPNFIQYYNNFLYLYNTNKHSFHKYDKNGICTNFIGDDFGNETLNIDIKKNNKILFIQFLHKYKSFFIIDHHYNILLYDIEGYIQNNIFITSILSFIPNPSDLYHLSFYYHEENDLLYIYNTNYILTIHLDKKDAQYQESIISYDPLSNFVPTTNIEVIQFLCSKKSIYKKILDGFQHSKQYLHENKEYFIFYYDYIQKQTFKIPSYELIFILQNKFQLSLQDYKNDPFIQTYPQHFPHEKYNFYQSKKKLYNVILQTYKEALLYQKLCDDLQKVLFYDDYKNLTDNIQLIFYIHDPFIFPRVYQSEQKGTYNKKQCVIMNKSLFL